MKEKKNFHMINFDLRAVNELYGNEESKEEDEEANLADKRTQLL